MTSELMIELRPRSCASFVSSSQTIGWNSISVPRKGHDIELRVQAALSTPTTPIFCDPNRCTITLLPTILKRNYMRPWRLYPVPPLPPSFHLSLDPPASWSFVNSTRARWSYERSQARHFRPSNRSIDGCYESWMIMGRFFAHRKVTQW